MVHASNNNQMSKEERVDGLICELPLVQLNISPGPHGLSGTDMFVLPFNLKSD